MSSRRPSALVLLIAGTLGLLAGGCLDASEVSEEVAEPCAACHGDAAREGDALLKAAPPRNLDGEMDVAAAGVGAHQVHLDPGGRAAPVSCETCHVVPDETYSPGHVDTPLPAEIVFGDAARGDGDPVYDVDTGSCADVYCHGSAEPVWLEPRSPDQTCGTCHELPPPAPHPAGDDCSTCHGTVIDSDGEFVDPDLHVNGEVNVGDLSCNACHGTGTLGAPPPDLEGSDRVSARGVGAHAEHLEASYSHEPVLCEACHVVPETVGDDGHIDESPPADIRFDGLALADGADPTYDAAESTCADSYCHRDATPVWTEPRSSDDACGSCHGVPPAAPHPQDAQCGKCHSAVMDLDGDFVDRALHVNGSSELDDLQCSSCHGAGNLGAPPPDLSGSTDPTAPGVGAHELHLTPSDAHAAVACDECHVVPATTDAAGHQDDPPVELAFGALATTGGANPVYDFAENTCTDSYCHGDTEPNWIAPRPADEVCGSCHPLPPAAPHPPGTDCSQCHGEVIGSDGSFTAPERHVDGVVDYQLGCDSCHGAGSLGAPPPDLSGNTLATAPGVGAHELHLAGGDFRAITCEECHVVPDAIEDAGHVDNWGRAEVTMSGVAETETSSPSWDPDTLTCADSWCHGPRGANATSPAWNEQPNLGCSDCHGFPPPAPHPPRSDCSSCHSTVDASLAFLLPEQHGNGVVEVELDCNTCHGRDVSNAPPVDLAGNTDVTAPGVGVHQAHLSANSSFRSVDCGDCHVVPVNVDDPGHLDDWGTAEVVMSGVAVAEASAATWDAGTLTCSNTWCHGPRGANATSPVWTEPSNLGCTGCHGFPPPIPHPPRSDCSSCHSTVDASLAFLLPEQHANGVVEVGGGCNICHGSDTSDAPPVDLAGNADVTAPGVGAHQAHLFARASFRSVECGDCHVVPVDVDDSGHVDDWGAAEVVMSGVAVAEASAATWDSATLTCSNTWCHGPRVARVTPEWTDPLVALSCDGCHTFPPAGAPHSASTTACGDCHSAGGLDTPENHVDGNVDFN